MAQRLKHLPAMQETWVRSLVWEDLLEESMATHSSVLAWRSPMDTGAWLATVHGVEKSWTRLKQLNTASRAQVKLLAQRPHIWSQRAGSNGSFQLQQENH